eukprot:SAG31_NODE_3864_length_3803_cov_1.622300_1_plen_494_part_00
MDTIRLQPEVVEHSYRTFSKWFRDPEVFEYLLDSVLFQLAKRHAVSGDGRHNQTVSKSKVVGCWVCGCSAGEEAYSIAMMWDQGIRRTIWAAGLGVDLSVIGTDISTAAIEAARRAEYTQHAVQDVPAAWLERCFSVSSPEGRLSEADRSKLRPSSAGRRLPSDPGSASSVPTLAPEYALLEGSVKSACRFEVQDVLQAMPNDQFALISCRYAVFLYLSWSEGRMVLERMVTSCMLPGCILVIGPTERLPEGYGQLGLKPVAQCPGVFQLAGDSANPRASNMAPPAWTVHDTLTAYLKTASEAGTECLAPRERLNVKTAVEEAPKLSAQRLKGQIQSFALWETARRARQEAAREAARQEEEALCKPTKALPADQLAAMVERLKPKPRERHQERQGTARPRPKWARPSSRGRTNARRKGSASPLDRPSTNYRRLLLPLSERLERLSQPRARLEAWQLGNSVPKPCGATSRLDLASVGAKGNRRFRSQSVSPSNG